MRYSLLLLEADISAILSAEFRRRIFQCLAHRRRYYAIVSPAYVFLIKRAEQLINLTRLTRTYESTGSMIIATNGFCHNEAWQVYR
jgi:hypothetical protein